MRNILGGLLVTVALAACSKDAKKGPDITEADKTAEPTKEQCLAAYAHADSLAAAALKDDTVVTPEMKKNGEENALSLCHEVSTVALVKCDLAATDLGGLVECGKKYRLTDARK